MQVKSKDVLHLYIGQEVIYGFEGRKKKGHLVGKREPFGWQVFDPSLVMANYRDVRDELIKPVLRPLSDMMEDEAWECHEISYDDIKGESVRGYYSTMPFLEPKQFLYLLSRGFDLFGLIESGQAIDKTKL